MKSNFVPANQLNNIPWDNEGYLTTIIDEQIEWYDKNSTRKEDDYIKAQLKLIKNLAENIESSDDIMFLESIFETMCKIFEMQRDVISELEGMQQQWEISGALPHGYVPLYTASTDVFLSDEQIRAAFTARLQNDKSPFTINDYILRVQNLWRSFYSECQTGEIPRELAEHVTEDNVDHNNPLLNAYNFIDELNRYISMKIASDSDNRNLHNARAALNTFGKALCGDSYEKTKSDPKEVKAKDFSKYLFNGNTYGKSRLVLAVVKKYVEDHHPATFDELEEAFPSSIQGSLGVVRRIEDVSDKYKGVGGVKRYFVGDVIELASGEQVIVCTQFGAPNTEKFVEHVTNKLGYIIDKV